MTAKQLYGLMAPDGSRYRCLTDGNGNLVLSVGTKSNGYMSPDGSFYSTLTDGSGNLVNANPGAPNTFYVDSVSGSDSNDGMSPNTAWQTLSKVQTSVPTNMSVLFKAGSVFSTTYTVQQASITHGSYGVGANPIFDGSTPIVSTWTAGNGVNYPTTVWAITQTTNPLMPVFPSGVQAIAKASAATCTATGHWFWDSTGHLLYVYGPTNPGTSIGIPTRSYCIDINGQQNCSFGNITVRGSIGGLNVTSGGGLYLHGNFSGLTLTSGFVAENNYENGVGGYEGTSLIQNISFTNGVFRNNGASGFHLNVAFMLNNYFGMNRAYGNCCILTNATSDLTFSGGLHWFSNNANTNGNAAANAGQGTIVENNWSYNNGLAGQASNATGMGIFPDTVNGFIIRNNNVYGNQTDGIHIEKNGSTICYNNNCWNNAVVANSQNLNNICSGGQNSSNNQIFNNTIYGGYYALSANPYQGLGSSTFNSNTFTNNISVNASHSVQLLVATPGGDNLGGKGTGNIYTFNCFGPAGTGFIDYGATACNSYAAFDTAVGSATNSVQGNPNFTNPTASPPDFSLQAGSPCIGASTAIAGYITAGTNLGSSYPASL